MEGCLPGDGHVRLPEQMISSLEAEKNTLGRGYEMPSSEEKESPMDTTQTCLLSLLDTSEIFRVKLPVTRIPNFYTLRSGGTGCLPRFKGNQRNAIENKDVI